MSSDRVISANRLRIGVVLIILWFLPFWLLGPWLAKTLGFSDQESAGVIVTGIIVVVQTIIGLAGAYVTGKEASTIIKSTPRKYLLKTVLSVLKHGTLERS